MNIDNNYPDVTTRPSLEVNGGEITGDILVNTGSKVDLNNGTFGGQVVSNDQTGTIAVNGGNYAQKPADEYIQADAVAKYTPCRPARSFCNWREKRCRNCFEPGSGRQPRLKCKKAIWIWL